MIPELSHVMMRLRPQSSLNGEKMPITVPWFTRNDLAKLFEELNFVCGVEVGVEKGLFSRVLCEANPQLRLYGVDPWASYAVYGGGGIAQWQCDSNYKQALENIKGLNISLIRETSDNACRMFLDGALDFVYIDGDHSFRAVTNDVLNWMPKVRKGGIVAGHDYHVKKNWRGTHVVPVINALTEVYGVRPWFVFDTQRKGVPPSWMWVRE